MVTRTPTSEQGGVQDKRRLRKLARWGDGAGGAEGDGLGLQHAAALAHHGQRRPRLDIRPQRVLLDARAGTAHQLRARGGRTLPEACRRAEAASELLDESAPVEQAGLDTSSLPAAQ